MNENILLTITMLVSDRKDTIEKCMKSLVHLRETIPSELIVVDTAGNEDCMNIVRQYTDNIVRFEWCDDFAAARNAGLERARGRWLMYLDDDEWFESTQELENFLLSDACRKYNAATYVQRNYRDVLGLQWDDVDVIRVVKREKGMRFKRKIHEFIEPIKDPICYLHDYVHHYGYIYKTPEDRNRHYWRNIKLLLELHEETPKDTHTTAQLIQEYVGVEEYFSAIQLCREIWMMKGCWDTTFDARYATYAMMTEARLYSLQKRYADGYEVGKEMLGQKGISLLAQGILCDFMTEFCWHLNKYEEALAYCDRYFDCLKKWKKFPNKKSLDAFSACAKYMDPQEIGLLTLLRLHLYVLLKDWKKAEEAFLSIDWQNGVVQYMRETPADMIALLTCGSYRPEYLSTLSALYGKEGMRPLIYTAIDALGPEDQEKLLPYLCQIPPQDVKMCSYHIIYAGNQGDMGAAISALEKMHEWNLPFFQEDEAYWSSLQKLNINLNAYMTDLNIYHWMEMAKRLWDVLKLDACEKAYSCLVRGLERTDLRYLHINALLMEKKLLEKEKVLEKQDEDALTEYTAEEIWNDLYQMSQFWVSCAASLFREDVFMGDLISAIPHSYQFGWYIMQAGAVKNDNASLFIHKVADAAKAYPAFKELCKKVIRASA